MGGVQAAGAMGTGAKSKYARPTTTMRRMKSPKRFLRDIKRIRLAFAALVFYRRLQCDSELAYSGLVHRLDKSERFVKYSTLMFGPIRHAADASKLAVVERHTRRPH